jgi:hypothetical protein
MSSSTEKSTPILMVVLAFATVYTVWGSTYFFIQVAVKDFPAFILGALRFVIVIRFQKLMRMQYRYKY